MVIVAVVGMVVVVMMVIVMMVSVVVFVVAILVVLIGIPKINTSGFLLASFSSLPVGSGCWGYLSGGIGVYSRCNASGSNGFGFSGVVTYSELLFSTFFEIIMIWYFGL